MGKIEIYPIKGIPLIRAGVNIAEIILDSIIKNGINLMDNDILAITEKIVSKAEGRIVKLDEVVPSRKAVKIANMLKKDPRIVELILRESKNIVAIGENFIIVETRHGFVCANAGIDESNIEYGYVKLLPENPDKSADNIRKFIERKTGKKIGVIIVDSFGRPFRNGSIGVAIGASGIVTLWDRRGHRDIYGRTLKVTRVAVADCLASIACLVFGEADERIPAAIIRGFKFCGYGKAKDLIRDKNDYFKEIGINYVRSKMSKKQEY